MTKVHELKCWPEPFQALKDCRKTCEWRKDDRGFDVGDTLHLREYIPPGHGVLTVKGACWVSEPTLVGGYTGQELRMTVTDIQRGPNWGIPEGYVMMSVKPTPPAGAPAAGAKEYHQQVMAVAEEFIDAAWRANDPTAHAIAIRFRELLSALSIPTPAPAAGAANPFDTLADHAIAEHEAGHTRSIDEVAGAAVVRIASAVMDELRGRTITDALSHNWPGRRVIDQEGLVAALQVRIAAALASQSPRDAGLYTAVEVRAAVRVGLTRGVVPAALRPLGVDVVDVEFGIMDALAQGGADRE